MTHQLILEVAVKQIHLKIDVGEKDVETDTVMKMVQ